MQIITVILMVNMVRETCQSIKTFTQKTVLNNINISILGAGWLGQAFGEFAVTQGCTVKASTRSPEKMQSLEASGLKPYCIDIQKLNQADPDFFKCDVLLITMTHKALEPYQALIHSLMHNGPKKILHIGTTSVYPNTKGVVSASSPVQKNMQWEIEECLRQTKHSDATVLRFSGLFSADRHPGRFFKAERIIPNPSGPINMIHKDDCVNIIWRIIDGEFWGYTFNACADKHPSRKAFYTAAQNDYGRSNPSFGADIANEGKEISNAFLKRTLDYQFIHPDPISALGK